MKFSVGLAFGKSDFTECIIKNKDKIHEVYFSWGDFANGRGNQLVSDVMTQWEMQNVQNDTVKKISDAGIKLNLLFNANCYGKYSQSRAFFNKIGDTVDYLDEKFTLSSITTCSPLIAKFIKENFENISVRASVNMEIGTVEGMKYIAKYFDSYYMKRELNRDKEKIKPLSEWCRANGKELFMLVNSGCLNHCSAHNFHDNLVAHETEISEMDNAYDFHGMCAEYLRDENNLISLICDTNFVRPEDISDYDGYFTAAKLATRINPRPVNVLESYIAGKYSGNILELLEPYHNVYPYVVENGEPLKLKRIDDVFVLEENEKENKLQ